MTVDTTWHVPTHVDADGRRWNIERAWPARHGIDVEVSHPDQPHRRGGRWSSDDGIELLTAGSDPKLPALAREASTGTVISHRPGRRAVVRSSDGTRFTKIVRPGRGAALHAAASAALRVQSDGIAMPSVIDAGDDRLVLGALPGRSLLEVASDPDSITGWTDAWRAWADLWPEFAARTDVVEEPERHDATAEAEVLTGWQDKASTVLAGDARDRLRSAVAAVTERLAGGQPSPEALCHRDLHDQQVLWHPRRGIGLLDVDTLTIGEAALDLGNLRAHVALRTRQGFTTAQQARVAGRCIDDVAARLGVDPHRLTTYADATAIRLVCVYAFRPRWRAMALSMLAEIS